jgi:hypothetical protein
MVGEFHVGGHVPPESPAYADRQFVQECFSALSGGNWVVLLGPRQHGKTSGLVRLSEMLREANVQVARLSLQGIPDIGSVQDLFEWTARKVAGQLGVDLVSPSEEDCSDLAAWLAAALPQRQGQVALLFDEAAAIRDDEVRSNFYQQLRRLHDERDSPRVPSLGEGLLLLFSGTFEPERLVADDRVSPFNVCRRVETQDLTRDAVEQLLQRLDASQATPFLDRAMDLAGGQPYLLQHLFSEAERGDAATTAEERFGRAEERLLAGDSDHLINLVGATVNDPPVRQIVEQMLQEDGGAPFAPTPEHRMVITLGLARRDGVHLVPRNRLYGKVASDHFLLAAAGNATAEAVVAPPGVSSLDFVVDPELKTIAGEMLEAGVDAFNRGHVRLGLIGLGSALEAILIDVLEQADQAERDQAKERANPDFSRWEEEADPNTWRLVNLIKVADKLPSLDGAPIGAADAIRELRNYVHPAVSRASGIAQDDLKDEFGAARAVLGIVVREVG